MKDNIFEFYNLVGQNMKEFRKRTGLSQDEFANKIGKSRSFISQIENPGVDKGISLDTLYNC